MVLELIGLVMIGEQFQIRFKPPTLQEVFVYELGEIECYRKENMVHVLDIKDSIL